MVCVAGTLEVDDDADFVELAEVCATAQRTTSASVIKSRRMSGCDRYSGRLWRNDYLLCCDDGLYHEEVPSGLDGENEE